MIGSSSLTKNPPKLRRGDGVVSRKPLSSMKAQRVARQTKLEKYIAETVVLGEIASSSSCAGPTARAIFHRTGRLDGLRREMSLRCVAVVGATVAFRDRIGRIGHRSPDYVTKTRAEVEGEGRDGVG